MVLRSKRERLIHQEDDQQQTIKQFLMKRASGANILVRKSVILESEPAIKSNSVSLDSGIGLEDGKLQFSCESDPVFCSNSCPQLKKSSSISASRSKRASPNVRYTLLQNVLSGGNATRLSSSEAQQPTFGRSPSMEMDESRSYMSRHSRDSPSVTSDYHNNQELDDYIIDEILSLEDERQFRHYGGNDSGMPPSKAQHLPMSFSCADNLTMSSSLNSQQMHHPHQTNQHQQGNRNMDSTSSSGSRPIPSHGGSSGNTSLQSGCGSPVGNLSSTLCGDQLHSPNVLERSGSHGSDNFRHIVSSSAPTSSFDMEAFVRRGAASSAGANGGNGGEGSVDLIMVVIQTSTEIGARKISTI
uniref:Uncharacterized protein n=1 Tax=Ditylenchus dipsaci TaxID=166011 RepID=A0A915D157_9BILA